MSVSPEVTRHARVSKTTHDMICNVPEQSLIADLLEIGVAPEEAADILEEAKSRVPQIRADYRASVRQDAMWWLVIGAVLVLIVLLLDRDRIPLLREGRYFLAVALGAGGVAYGGFRFLFPEIGLKPIRNRYSRHTSG